MRALLAGCLLIAALGALPTCKGEEAKPGSAPPQGWWRVEKSEPDDPSTRGGAFRFRAEGYDLVRADGQRDARLGTWSRAEGRWRCAGSLPFELFDAGAGRLRLVVAGPRTLHLVQAGAAEAARLDAVVSEPLPVEAVCDRAERCCLEGMALLGSRCDVAFELAGKTSARTCQASLEGMRTLLERAGQSVPAACRSDEAGPSPQGGP